MYENVSISQVHFRSEMDMSKVNITSRIVVHSDRVGTASQQTRTNRVRFETNELANARFCPLFEGKRNVFLINRKAEKSDCFLVAWRGIQLTQDVNTSDTQRYAPSSE